LLPQLSWHYEVVIVDIGLTMILSSYDYMQHSTCVSHMTLILMATIQTYMACTSAH